MFAKPPAGINGVNDLNGEIVHFYRTVTAANIKHRKQEEWMVVNYALPENPN